MPYLSRAEIEQIGLRVVNAYWKLGAQDSDMSRLICQDIVAQNLLGLSVE